MKDTIALISIVEGASRLGISKFTLRSWIRLGVIPHVRLRRRVLLDPRDLDRFIQASRIEARSR